MEEVGLAFILRSMAPLAKWSQWDGRGAAAPAPCLLSSTDQRACHSHDVCDPLSGVKQLIGSCHSHPTRLYGKQVSCHPHVCRLPLQHLHDGSM